MKASIVALTLLLAFMLPSFAASQTAGNPNYPVMVLDRDDGIIGIADRIDFRTPLAFEKVIAEVPNASVLLLNSPGGLVHSALSIATRVRGLGLTTVVADEHECLSACALVFFAGNPRLAFGKLGVHQISSTNGDGDMVGGQFALADVIEALNEYDVPPEVIGLMLRTPPEEMYVFSPQENRSYGFLVERQAETRNSTPLRSRTDLSNPETWRGKVITGQLVSNGKKWYASLNPDGSTTFQFSSGQRSNGRYYLTDSEVCFKLDQNSKFACRRPVSSSGSIRCYDEKGAFQSVILSVDDSNFGDTNSLVALPRDVSEYISPGNCALIVASRRTIAEAREFVMENVPDRRYLRAFKAKNGWIAIAIGTLRPEEVEKIIADWKAIGRIPADSYCSTGSSYEAVVSLGLE